jgi:endoglucanase
VKISGRLVSGKPGKRAIGRPCRLAAAALVAAIVSVPGSLRAADGWADASWRKYLERFVQRDGRVIDPSVPPGVTTSEGQAYTLLRAVWSSDRATFDRVLRWTVDNLARKGSPLFAWKWGRKDDGGWGVLDANTATDADVHLAFAILAAAERWKSADLEKLGVRVVRAIWDEEVRSVGGEWFLLPGNWAKDENPIPLNPSYFSPALLRRLARFDAEHPWDRLVAETYRLASFRLPVTGLPPDWVLLQKATGELTIGSKDETLKGRFGPDAYRVFFNFALDYAWDRTPAALEYLKSHQWLVDFLNLNATLPREVSIDALPRISGPEPLALYGSLYPSLVLLHRDASQRARRVLDAVYKDGLWGENADYYNQNLVWFGLALGEGLLPPLLK